MALHSIIAGCRLTPEEQALSARRMRECAARALARGHFVPLAELAAAFGSLRFPENKELVARMVEREGMAFDDGMAFWIAETNL